MHCQLRRLAWHWYLLLYFYERDCLQQCWLKYEMKAEMKRKAVNTGLPSCLCVCLPYLLSQFVFQVPQCVVFLPKFFTWTSSYDPICFTGTRTLMRTRIVCVGHSEKSSWESRCSSCLFSVALDQALHLWRLFSYFCKKKKYSEESNEIRLELGPVNRIRKNCNSLKTCNAMWELRSRKSSRQSSKKRGDTSLEFLNQRWPCMCLRDDLLPERADAVFSSRDAVHVPSWTLGCIISQTNPITKEGRHDVEKERRTLQKEEGMFDGRQTDSSHKK